MQDSFSDSYNPSGGSSSYFCNLTPEAAIGEGTRQYQNWRSTMHMRTVAAGTPYEPEPILIYRIMARKISAARPKKNIENQPLEAMVNNVMMRAKDQEDKISQTDWRNECYYYKDQLLEAQQYNDNLDKALARQVDMTIKAQSELLVALKELNELRDYINRMDS